MHVPVVDVSVAPTRQPHSAAAALPPPAPLLLGVAPQEEECQTVVQYYAKCSTPSRYTPLRVSRVVHHQRDGDMSNTSLRCQRLSLLLPEWQQEHDCIASLPDLRGSQWSVGAIARGDILFHL